MATVSDTVGVNDGATMNVSAVILFDDVTGLISRVTWSNNGTRDVRCTIYPPDRLNPVIITMQAGRTNVRVNVSAQQNLNYLNQNFGMSLDPI